MRLVLVHGINNQGGTEQRIIDDWLRALAQRLPDADMVRIRRAEVIAPFYGDVLHTATERLSAAGPEPIAMGVADVSSDEAKFYRLALEDIASAAGVTETQILAEAGVDDAVELGLADDRRLLALFRALERLSPWQGRIVLRLLPQAFVYLYRAAAAAEVDKIVRPALTEKPCIVVGHSLGSVVVFKLLRMHQTASVPLYVSLGSPLALAAVKNAIGPVFARPASVSNWLNGLDPDDAVTIGRALKENTFGPGIENIDDIENGIEAHDVQSYLRDKRIAERLARSL